MFSARHHNAAVVTLQQVVITLSEDTHSMTFLNYIKMLGDSRKHQLSVATFINGTTIDGKPRLDLMLSWVPEHDIYCCRVNNNVVKAVSVHITIFQFGVNLKVNNDQSTDANKLALPPAAVVSIQIWRSTIYRSGVIF